MPLIIQKQPYISLPWRLVLVRGEDTGRLVVVGTALTVVLQGEGVGGE